AYASKVKKFSVKCNACHSFKNDGKHRTGPNLWDIVNKPISAQDGYSYSSAFNEKKGQMVWDEATLDAFLIKPKKLIKGTKMAFPGIRKEQDRADLIAWLKEQK
ncbi:MAG: cytochrome c, partial [bacterium]